MGDAYTDRYFDEIFLEFDVDGSGDVEKIEMICLIKRILGIKTPEIPRFAFKQNLGFDIFDSTKSNGNSMASLH